jgi:WD40 repeat protein
VIRFHPDGKSFLMAGKLAQGKWNAALFDSASGRLLYSLDTKIRITDAAWLNNGATLALSGASSQEKKKDGRCPDFGHIRIYEVQRQPA